MLRHDKFWMFARGFPAFLFYWLGFGIGVGYSRELLIDLYEQNETASEDELVAEEIVRLLPVLVGSFLCHPFFVVGCNVVYARFYPTMIARQQYQNSISAFGHILKTLGISGLYRGLVPGTVWMTYLHRHDLQFD